VPDYPHVLMEYDRIILTFYPQDIAIAQVVLEGQVQADPHDNRSLLFEGQFPTTRIALKWVTNEPSNNVLYFSDALNCTTDPWNPTYNFSC
jgi:hypothetical protein